MPSSSFFTDGPVNTGAAVAPAAPASFYVDPAASASSAAQAAASATSAAASAAAAALSITNSGPVFSFEGDSLSTTTSVGTWPTHLKNTSAFFARGSSHYFALPGDTAQLMVGEYATQAGAVSLQPGQEAYFFLWAGTNDIGAGSSGYDIYSYLSAIWASARASGYKVVAFTLPANAADGLYPVNHAAKMLANYLILSNPTLYDYLVRLDLLIPDTTSSYISIDGTHYTEAGNQLIAQEVARTVLGVGSVGAAPSAPTAALASENLFINGDFAISQEMGSSSRTLTSGVAAYAADGAGSYYKNTAGVVTTQRVLNPGVAGLSGSHVLTATTALSGLANGDAALHRYIVEGSRFSKLAWGSQSAQPLTYAFTFKSTNAGVAALHVHNGIDNHFYTELTVSAGLNFFTGVIPGDIIGTWATDASPTLFFEIISAGKATTPVSALGFWGGVSGYQTTNSTNLLSTTNAQTVVAGMFLCAGAVQVSPLNLPLLLRPAEDALRLCQRHYVQVPVTQRFYSTGAGQAVEHTIGLPVPMRATPTITTTPGTRSIVSSVVTAPFAGLFNYRRALTASGAGDCYTIGDLDVMDARFNP